MPTAGDPFDTPGLAEQRAEQRQVLRMVEDEVWHRLFEDGPPPMVIDDAQHSSLIERELRRLAAQDRIALDGLLRSSREATRSGTLAHFLDANQPQLSTGTERQPFRREIRRLRRGQQQHSILNRLDRRRDILRRFITLLVWADQLAGDYVDPRVRVEQ